MMGLSFLQIGWSLRSLLVRTRVSCHATRVQKKTPRNQMRGGGFYESRIDFAGYGKRNTAPVVTPAWTAAAFKLSGIW